VSRFTEALAGYESADRILAQLHDEESRAIVHIRRSGVLRDAGQYELAYESSFATMRDLLHIADIQERHVLLGENATNALSLDHAGAAFLHQDAAVRLVRTALAATSPDVPGRIARLQTNLAIALRQRAIIRIHLGDLALAGADLDEAIRIGNEGETRAAELRRSLNARMAEVRGQLAMQRAPGDAIAAFSDALRASAADDFFIYRAALLAQRAEAYRNLHKSAEAERDMIAAFGQLQAEQKRIFENPAPDRDTLL